MKIAVLGHEGPLRRGLGSELESRGHELSGLPADVVVYLVPPAGEGFLEELERLAASASCRRLVLRSHAYAYGSSAKNPGLLTEDYASRLPSNAAAQRWLRAEEVAARHPNACALRLTTVLDPAEGDRLVRNLTRGWGVTLAGRDPNVQFLSLDDAVRALAAAAESEATGVFNVAGAGVIPLKKALRAAGAPRLPLPEFLFRRGHEIDQLHFNWTLSSERAAREIPFRPSRGTVEALRDYLSTLRRGRPDLLKEFYDDWGLDVDYIRSWEAWFTLLGRLYWRVESEGLDHIPLAGRALFVASHRGFMPLDAVIHLYTILRERQRILRFLIIPSLLSMPFLSNFLTKLGGVVANQTNAARLFADENLVGIFPEGIRGAFTPYRSAYRLGDFSKTAFAKIAVENQAPIIPVAVVGHAEIFPIIGRINWSYVTRALGWPYLPIAPMFPLAPVPIPSKWHVRVLEPVPVSGFRRDDGSNKRLMREFSRYVQSIIQENIDDMVTKRKSWFWGKVLDGTAPRRTAFEVERQPGGARA